MRVAVYNQMFGLNGRKFWSTVVGNFYAHCNKNPKGALRRMRLNETLQVITEANADIIGICEVYESQKKEIKDGLGKLGYRYFYFSTSHKFKFSKRRVLDLVASKIKGKQLRYKNWPKGTILGGGGGFVACKFPGLNLLHVHMALPVRNCFPEQMCHVKKILGEMKGKTIVMGDFNRSYRKLRKYFADFTLATGRMQTCTMTPVLKWIYHKDIDHIMIHGFKTQSIGTLEGKSDHKLVYADLK